MVQKLQDQVCTLELSLASQANLPSVRPSQGGVDLWEEVFNYLSGTVNTNWGVAMYELWDQAFPFQKHVQFGDRSQVPDLKLDTDFPFQKHVQFGDRSQVPDLKLDTDPSNHLSSSHTISCSFTPHCGHKPLNWTFDVSQISPLTGNPHDAMAIMAEVLAAAAAQASKSFTVCMNPRLPNLRAAILLMPN